MPESGTRTVEERIRDLVEAERQRLLREAGLERSVEHFRLPEERPFRPADRTRTTLLFSGLTARHEEILQAALENLGYRSRNLPVPDLRSLEIGKEYGNNGQCNPNYFTVGNLVKFLQGLRAAGMSRRRILEEYVFFTAGACGPCRFGMYEAEFRLALSNAGFDGFRVVVFQQKAGLSQTGAEAGLRFDLDFFLGLITTFEIGDLLNEVGYQIRPYEVEPGATDHALSECTRLLAQAMRERPAWRLERSRLRLLRRWGWAGGRLEKLGKYLTELRGRHFVEALREARGILDAVRVDRTRIRPRVKITGEFWAQLTEGDGNFHMFRFLEGEGAEVCVEPLTNWLFYMLWQGRRVARDRFGLPGRRNPWTFLAHQLRLALASRLLTRHYDRLRGALGSTTARAADPGRLTRLAHPYYHSRAQGGEGNLEVAKNIHYETARLSHMVLSLKPFGCLPSTQSDGVQAAVVSRHPDMVFLPIETAGEGAINAYSRVQMALGDARRKAREEFEATLESTGRGLEEIREFVAEHPELSSGLYRIPPDRSRAGTAARFVAHAAARMGGRR